MTDTQHCSHVVGCQAKCRLHRAGALDEQPHGRPVGGGIQGHRLAGLGNCQRLHRQVVLAAQTKLRSAGGQHLEARAADQQIGDDWRPGQQVLIVVEQEQEALIAQRHRQALDHRQLARFANPERRPDDGR